MRFTALVRKELGILYGNRTFAAIGLMAPLLAYMIFYLLLGSDITFGLPVVDPEGQVLSYLSESRNPSGTPYLDPDLLDKDIASDRLEAAEIAGYAEVNDNMTIWFGRVDLNLVKNISNRVNHVYLSFLEDNREGPEIHTSESNIYEKDIEWIDYMTPGLFVYGLLLAGSIIGATLMTREFETKGTRLLSLAPKNLARMYLAKILAASFLAILAAGIFLVVAGLTSGFVPINISFLLLVFASLIIFATTFGLVVGLIVRSSIPAFLLLLILNLSMWIIAGGFGKVSLFAETLQILAKLTPTYYAINLVRYAIFGDQGPGGIYTQATGLLVITMIIVTALISLNHIRIRKPA